MSDKILRIATRQSPLALWQAHYVQQRLMACHPGLSVELVPMVTKGDIILDTPLAKVGGKGLFVKELEQAEMREQPKEGPGERRRPAEAAGKERPTKTATTSPTSRGRSRKIASR